MKPEIGDPVYHYSFGLGLLTGSFFQRNKVFWVVQFNDRKFGYLESDIEWLKGNLERKRNETNKNR